MKQLVLIFLFIVTSLHLTKSQSCSESANNVEIICSKISSIDFGYNVGSLLSCHGDSSIISTYPDSVVSKVINSDQTAVKNISQIKALYIVSATIKFIPYGIKAKFPSIEAITIDMGGLLSVNRDNLKEFGSSLEYLVLSNNLITTIDADLFSYNPNMKFIYLDFNPIQHMEAAFFTNLKNLKQVGYVYFQHVGCMNQYFNIASGHNLVSFQWKNSGCTDRKTAIEALSMRMLVDVKRKQNFDNRVCSDVKHENIELRGQLRDLADNNKKLSENLNNWMESVDKKLESLNKFIN